ncbi:HEAT repeat domain-containing protein [Gloeothece verrucosa]|uniref:Putative signal transduction protein with Nacht domain n=1 Tax=Gloeothece verrucosa (strain PCC 7822) TaxID=497965 RepID=E0UHJ1_GLOV7|nr:HEAT repeat domain-containing protein [Gloeothece verrucosa]ADN12132.1 putative signal transduction protein with Nacht domain [Gloeothece verrucosa PCC 7822]
MDSGITLQRPNPEGLGYTNKARLRGLNFLIYKPFLSLLNNLWETYNLLALPDGFNWSQLSKRYVKKVKAILQENKELREIFISSRLDEIAENTQTEIKPNFDLIKYQETLQERYGNLPLDNLHHSILDRRIKLWGIFIAQNVRECQEYLPKVYEIPKEYQRRLKETGQLDKELTLEELEKLQKIYSSQPIRSVLEVIEDKKYKYVVILGDPGAGKSTLLKYLAIKWTELPIKELTVKPIPLLIELRDYIRSREEKECQTFLEFIHKSSGWVGHLNQHDLHETLKKGNALVMFDGLDEVFDLGQRQTVINQIHDLTQNYPNIQVIVTSRVIGYQPSQLRDAEFYHFMIQDLDEKQIDEFLEKWHNFTCDNERDRQPSQERLKQAINNFSSIEELAGNPLLLTMMAILNRSQELPRDRAELYNQCSRILLYQWDFGRALVEDKRIDPKVIDYKDKQALCRQVAYFMQSNEQGLAGNLISGDDLERILRDYLKTLEISNPRDIAKLIIHQLRHRNFILCLLGADYYAFVHRTFLEYFCASEFVWRFKESQTLSREELKTGVFGQHWRDETWHEVLRLIAGQIEPKFVGQVIEYLMSQDGEGDKFLNVFLAADCLNEVRNRKEIQEIEDKLLVQIKELLYYDDIDEALKRDDEEKLSLILNIRREAMKFMAIIWHDAPNTLAYIKTLAQSDQHEFVRGIAIEQLAQQYRDDPEIKEILKTCAQSDQHEGVRGIAIEQLAQQYRDDPGIQEFLKTCAQSDQDSWVRGIAIEQLAQQYRDDPGIQEFLKTCAQSDQDSWVRRTAIEQLAQQYRDDPGIQEFLKTCAQSDQDSWVRRTAIEQLAQQYPDDPGIQEFLKTFAQSDQDKFVRGEAIEQLAQQYRDDPGIQEFLKTFAQSDQDSWVRGKAIEQLAQQYRDDPGIQEFLKTFAQSDQDSWVRGKAIEQLAQQYRDDPGIQEFLKTFAQSDQDSWVRRTAIVQLAQQYRDDPGIQEFLKTFAQSDQDSWVRRTAIEQLAQQYPDDPGIQEFLKTFAQSDQDKFVRGKAIEQLAQQYPDDPDIKEFLKTCAQSDQDSWVRRTAIEQIAQQYPDDPESKEILKTCAQSDQDEDVRETAIKQLAAHYKDDSTLFEFLSQCALKDPFQRPENMDTNPRKTALECLVKLFPNHSQLPALLQDRLNNDADEKVREYVRSVISEQMKLDKI